MFAQVFVDRPAQPVNDRLHMRDLAVKFLSYAANAFAHQPGMEDCLFVVDQGDDVVIGHRWLS
jgi:hypothetical protein